MSIATVIGVAIALFLVYYALSLIVNVAMAIIKDVFDIRAKALEEILMDLFDHSKGDANDLYSAFKKNSLISNLKPTSYRFYKWGKRERMIPDIPKDTFSLALLDTLDDKNLLVNGVIDPLKDTATPQMQEILNQFMNFNDDEEVLKQIKTGVLMLPNSSAKEQLLDLTDLLSADPQQQVRRIRLAVQKLPDGETKKALLASLSLNVKDIKDARARLENWFDDSMSRVGALFQQQTRSWVIAFSLILTLLVGADTIAIVQTLAEQPKAAAEVRENLDPLLEEFESGELSSEQAAERSTEEIVSSIQGHFTEISSILNLLDRLEDVDIFWKNPANPFARENWPNGTVGHPAKIIGLLITWLAVSQGSSFWYDILKKIKFTAPSPRKEESAAA